MKITFNRARCPVEIFVGPIKVGRIVKHPYSVKYSVGWFGPNQYSVDGKIRGGGATGKTFSKLSKAKHHVIEILEQDYSERIK